MNRLLMVLVIAAFLAVVLLVWVVARQRGQPKPASAVGTEPQQQEPISPQAPQWQQRRKEK